MITEDLKNYIAQSRQSGMQDADIKTKLLSTGWAEADIVQVFSENIPIPTPVSIKPNAFRGSIYGLIVLICLAGLAFLLYTSALLGMMRSGTNSSVALSLFFFGGFVLSLTFKFIVQATLLDKAGKLMNQNPSEKFASMKKKYDSAYFFSSFYHLVAIGGMVPYLQLLSIWVAIPFGAFVFATYTEYKFFRDLSKELVAMNSPENINLVILRISLILYYIFVPLMFVGLTYGLNSI
jgi:hypothetical protein